MPVSCPPVFLVQHMQDDFIPGFAERLDRLGEMRVAVAIDGGVARAGRAYLAPGGAHLEVHRHLGGLRMRTVPGLLVNNLHPATDRLFESLADARIPTLGVIMTGMGRDGTVGLLRLHEQGCHVLAQDEASSTIFGMARSAVEADAVDLVLPLKQIFPYLNEYFRPPVPAMDPILR